MNTGSTGERLIGRYEVQGELGRGAMGVVYRGFDPVIRRTVALKTMAFAAGDADARELRDRLYREAAAAGTLAHPNIVTIYDIIDDGATTAVAMEFVEGQTLADVLAQRGPLPVEEAIGIFEQMCSALDYAGSKGIVHRDIKPANVLMTADGRPKIMDFGIARMALQGVTQTSTIMGSPSYMSPEQVRGLPLDPRSDLFSAAVVFFEMVAGARPFGGDDVATTMYRIVNEPPRALDAAVLTVGAGLADVLGWALAKNPAERYATGAELVAAIRAALAGAAPAVPQDLPQSVPQTAATIVVQRAAAGRQAFAQTAEPEAVSEAVPVASPTRSKPMVLYGVIASGVLFAAVLLFVFINGTSSTRTAPDAGGGGAAAPAGTAPAPSPGTSTDAQPPSAGTTATSSKASAARAATPARVAAPGSSAPKAGTQTAALPAGSGASTPALAPAQVQPTTAAAPQATSFPAPPPMPAPSATAPGAPAGAAGAAGQAASMPTPATPQAQAAAAAVPPAAASAVLAAPEVTRATFAVQGENYLGVRVSVDGRPVPGSGPFQMDQITAGTHKVTYRWVSGPLNGREIEQSLTFMVGGVNRVRALPDASKLDLQFLARR